MVPVASWASAWSMRRAISWPGTSSPRSRCSSRIVRAREATPSVSQERSDPLDGIEVAAVLDDPDRAAVRERLVHGEVEAVRALLHPRAVERAGSAVRGHPPTCGALPGGTVGPV